jgi:hypothetical protein
VASVIHMRGNYIAELLSSWRGEGYFAEVGTRTIELFSPLSRKGGGGGGGRVGE